MTRSESGETMMLKQCPFCGGAATMEPWHGGGPDKQLVGCWSDECEARPSVTGETPEEAIAAWNTRATLTPTMEAAPVERGVSQRKILDAIYDEAVAANRVIALGHSGRGQGRIRVATALHRIAEWSKEGYRAALSSPPEGPDKEGV